MDYWKELYGKKEKMFIDGVIAGIVAYAYWNNGVQYVGTTGQMLEDAIKEAKEEMEYPE